MPRRHASDTAFCPFVVSNSRPRLRLTRRFGVSDKASAARLTGFRQAVSRKHLKMAQFDSGRNKSHVSFGMLEFNTCHFTSFFCIPRLGSLRRERCHTDPITRHAQGYGHAPQALLGSAHRGPRPKPSRPLDGARSKIMITERPRGPVSSRDQFAPKCVKRLHPSTIALLAHPWVMERRSLCMSAARRPYSAP